MRLLKSVKLELQAQPQYAYKKTIQQRADERIAQKLTMLKSSFGKRFNNYISWISHLVIGIAVFRLLAFILSALLHLGLMFALHRSERLHKFQPSYKLDEQKIPLKPNMFVEDQHLDRVRNEIFQWRNQSLLLLESQLMETKEEASARTYAHLDRQMHRV